MARTASPQERTAIDETSISMFDSLEACHNIGASDPFSCFTVVAAKDERIAVNLQQPMDDTLPTKEEEIDIAHIQRRRQRFEVDDVGVAIDEWLHAAATESDADSVPLVKASAHLGDDETIGRIG